jgi:uncharacterized membrane protein
VPASDAEQERRLAVTAQALYLTNLLLVPVVAFVGLLWLHRRRRTDAGPLGIAHLRWAVRASVVAGLLLVVANLAILLLGGYRTAGTWVVLVLYFTICHSTLVLLGMLNLARALSGLRPVPAGVGG